MIEAIELDSIEKLKTPTSIRNVQKMRSLALKPRTSPYPTVVIVAMVK